MLRYEPSTIQLQPPQAPGISPRLAGLLCARGAGDREAMEAFLHPSAAHLHDPLLLRDMDRALRRIRRAIGDGERICVYGDYDADGVCAAAILTDCLRRAGAEAEYVIPSRHSGGYGLSLSAVERLHEEGVELLITVDNGVKAYGEIERCRELGMDVIVTDHHRCDGRIPDCCAVVCHTREDDGYPNGDLCGAGIAMKLAEGLLGREEAGRYLPLAAIATMADVVPLLGENRAIVALGLGMINRGECSQGVKALCRVANDKARELSARDLSFGLAPRLNAAGRMEEAGICVGLLLSCDEAGAMETAQRLDALNALRRQEEEAIITDAAARIEAEDLTERRCIVLSSPDWNPGVIGIAAARISERYYRPTLLFSEKEGVLTGSARSVPGVDLYRALNENAGLYTRFGGHAYAAGVTMPAEHLPALIEGLERSFHEGFEEELFIPRRTYEAEVELSELTLQLAEELELLSPFGEGNPEPAFRTQGVLLRGLRRIGATGSHIKATAMKEDRYIDMVAFSQGHRFHELNDMERCDMIYTPSINQWQGMRAVQLRVSELRACEVEEPGAYISGRREKFVDAFSRNVLYNSEDGQEAGDSPDGLLQELLQAGIAGAAALCFTPEGAEDMLRGLKAAGAYRRLDIAFGANRPGPCAYHTAILAPVLEELELSRFRDVLLYDSRNEGLAARVAELAPKARIHLGRAYGLECFAGLAMGRQGMAAYYRAMAASERRFYNRAELGDYLAGVVGGPGYMAGLAVSIMAELGFINEEKGITLVRNAPQRRLEDSPTYRALERLKG